MKLVNNRMKFIGTVFFVTTALPFFRKISPDIECFQCVQYAIVFGNFTLVCNPIVKFFGELLQ